MDQEFEKLFKCQSLVEAIRRRDEKELDRLIQENGYMVSEMVDGSTALHVAARIGHPRIVQILLDHGARVNMLNEDGGTALHEAALKGHTDTVRLLLTVNAGVAVRNREGCTPLHLATEGGHTDVVDLLLLEQNSTSQVDMVDAEGRAAVHTCAANGHTAVLDLLLEANAQLNIVDSEGFTPLHLAAGQGHTETVHALIHNDRPNSLVDLNSLDKEGRTAGLICALNGHMETLKVLLDQGADVHIPDRKGNTILLLVGGRGDVDMTNEVMEYVNVDWINSEGRTPLHLCALGGLRDVVSKLLTNGADVKLADKLGCIALHLAAARGHTEIVKMLIENGSNVNSLQVDKRAPLHLAAQFRHLNTIRLLLERGAKINATCGDKVTAWHMAGPDSDVRNFLKKVMLLSSAIPKDDEEAVAFNIQPPFDVDDPVYGQQQTLLHLAATHGAENVTKLLVGNDHRANMELRDADEYTPLHRAIKNNSAGVVACLLQNGADMYAVVDDSTPLQLAVEEGQLEIAYCLVEQAHGNNHKPALHLNSSDKSYPRILWAVSGNDYQMTSKLLNCTETDVSCADQHGIAPLHIAVAYDSLEVTKLLVRHDAKLRQRRTNGDEPLHIAAAYNSAKTMEFLIRRGTNRFGENNRGEIPLETAVRHDSLAACCTFLGLTEDCLLVEGMNHLNALQWAVYANDVSAVENLTRRSTDNNWIDVNSQDALGRTALHMASPNNSFNALEKLLNGSEISVDMQDDYGYAPLHAAYLDPRGFNVYKMLLRHKHLVHDSNGNTVLHLIATFGDREGADSLVDLLNEKDLKKLVHATNKAMETPLHIAVSEEHSEIAKILLDHGAKIDAINNSDKSPLDLAKEKPEMLYMLQEARIEILDISDEEEFYRLVRDNEYDHVKKMIIEEGFDVNQRTKRDKITPLQVAAQTGDVKMGKLLMAHGADLDMVDHLERSPFHAAAARSEATMLTWLLALETKVNVNKPDAMGRTPVHTVAKHARPDSMRELLKRGTDVSPIMPDKQMMTPLHLAVSGDGQTTSETNLGQKKDIICQLLGCAQGVKELETVVSVVASATFLLLLTGKEEEKHPLVMHIMQKLNPKMMKSFLESKAIVCNELASLSKVICKKWSKHTIFSALAEISSPSELKVILALLDEQIVPVTNFLGQNALHILAEDGLDNRRVQNELIEKFKMLHDKGISLERTDVNGRNPLHLACRRGNFQLAKYILEGKFDASGQDVQGRNALHYLLRHYDACGSSETNADVVGCIDLLRSNGAATNIGDVEGVTPDRLARIRKIPHKMVFRFSQPPPGHSNTAEQPFTLPTVTETCVHERNINGWMETIKEQHPDATKFVIKTLKKTSEWDTQVKDETVERVTNLVEDLNSKTVSRMGNPYLTTDTILTGSVEDETAVGGINDVDFLARLRDLESKLSTTSIKLVDDIPFIVSDVEGGSLCLALKFLQCLLESVSGTANLCDQGFSIEDVKRNKLKVVTLVLSFPHGDGQDKIITADIVPTLIKEFKYVRKTSVLSLEVPGQDDHEVVECPLLMKGRGFEISHAKLERKAICEMHKSAKEAYKLLKLMRHDKTICPRLRSLPEDITNDDILPAYVLKQAILWVIDTDSKSAMFPEIEELSLESASEEFSYDDVLMVAVQTLNILLIKDKYDLPCYFCPSRTVRLTHHGKFMCRIFRGVLQEA